MDAEWLRATEVIVGRRSDLTKVSENETKKTERHVDVNCKMSLTVGLLDLMNTS